MPNVAHKALGSRKAWAALIGVAVTLFQAKLGLSADDVETIVNLLMAYIFGQGVVDASATFKKESSGA